MNEGLSRLVRRTDRMIIGLMSGTSTDGVGAALVDVRGVSSTTSWELVAFETRPYPDDLRDEILAVQDPATPNVLERVARLHFRLGEVYAESCASVARMAGFALGEVHLVGLHGQTVFHGTDRSTGRTPSTLQIGEAAVLAESARLPVVSNFRARDVAAGGVGAPLVPYVDYLLFRSEEEGRLCVNIGGIANFSALPASCAPDDVVAFDTGPGNMVIDALVEHYSDGKETFDKGGGRAARARPDDGLLQELMANDYLAMAPPKSAGREEFGRDFSKRLIARAAELKLSSSATISTATSFTARSIAEAYRLHVMARTNAATVLVSGGGVHNRTLMERLTEAMAPAVVQSTDLHGLDPDAKEAVAFALLANESIHGRAGNLPSVTGASHPVVLGSFTPGGPAGG